MIELPDFVSGTLIERTYHRALYWQDRARGQKDTFAAKRWLTIGMNRARSRDPRMLLFLEKGAEHLRKLNDAQQERFTYNERGTFQKQDFTEYASWREAFLKARDPQHDEETMYRVFGWIYAAVAEALG